MRAWEKMGACGISLRLIAAHCGSLRLSAGEDAQEKMRLVRLNAAHCGSLRLIAAHCDWLRSVAIISAGEDSCEKGGQRLIAPCCGSGCFTADSAGEDAGLQHLFAAHCGSLRLSETRARAGEGAGGVGGNAGGLLRLVAGYFSSLRLVAA